MAFGASSAVFGQFLFKPLLNNGGATGYTGLTAANAVKVALFNDSVTPDKNAAVGSTGFNTGTWLVANEVTDTGGGGNWVSGGRALSGTTVASVTNGTNFDASDLAGGGTVTITNAFGCMCYADLVTAGTVADQGICYNSFGSGQSVTSGTFTIVWNASGIFTITG